MEGAVFGRPETFREEAKVFLFTVWYVSAIASGIAGWMGWV